MPPIKNAIRKLLKNEENKDRDSGNGSNGADQPFFCFLPGSTGILSRLICKVLFMRPKIEPG
ncbi:MAG: hypothetical protein KGY38_06795, partial [Desulfobacterales bacterium]|nr:hypothetical protein [Desulfobacterales bacterium]